MFLLLTVIVAVALWSAIGTLRRRIEKVEASLSSITAVKNEVERLAARVRALELGQRPGTVDTVTLPPIVSEVPVVVEEPREAA